MTFEAGFGYILTCFKGTSVFKNSGVSGVDRVKGEILPRII